MSIHIKPYNRKKDFKRVGDFLIETFQLGNTFTNWLQPRWEYMHFHTAIRGKPLEKIGLFEEDGIILGVVHFEFVLREVYFQVRPGNDHIKEMMFDYAEDNFQGISQRTGRSMRALYIHENDKILQELARSNSYEIRPEFAESNSSYILNKPISEALLPEGFRLQSLADDPDPRKINHVLWRGFNHEGPPPEEEIEGREFMMQAPNFRKDLTIVAVAPDGNFASYGGMWVIPENKVAYVEPVATDPDYRRMGLGKAVVLESIRRAQADGAEIAWVGSDQEFYKAFGFEMMFKFDVWVKFLD
jgi:predicted N-acetyltransferase YhbS